jgi:hypothetical protein
LIFVKPRFDVYRAISAELHTLFHTYSDLVEPLSLDEAFLDVTHPKKGPPSATLIARMLRKEIRERTGCTVVALDHEGTVLLDIPNDLELGPDDSLYICGTADGIARYREEFSADRL